MAQLEAWFHAEFRQAQDSVAELPHAREFLEFCRARTFRTFLLSTIHGDHFKSQCRANGFDAFIDKPYTDVWDKRKKIHEHAAPKTICSPRKRCSSATWSTTSPPPSMAACIPAPCSPATTPLDQLRAAEPDLIVEHLAELRGVLEKNHFQFAADRAAARRSRNAAGHRGRADFQRRATRR